MDYVTIISLMVKAAPSILSGRKEAQARLQGEAYLKEKYHLTSAEVNVGFTMRTMETAYPIEWEKVLFSLLKIVLDAPCISLDLSEVCADIYIMVKVLRRDGHKLEVSGNYSSSYYRYVRSLGDSQTYESIQDLARGRGSSVTLQIVQKELRQWCAAESLDIEKK